MIDNHNNHGPEHDCCDYNMADAVGASKNPAILKLSKAEYELYEDLLKRGKPRDRTLNILVSHCLSDRNFPLK